MRCSASFGCLPCLSGGFAHDDWKLLAAAKIRTTLFAHPWYAWHALDAVDGNFRPLGAVLFFSFATKYAGLHPFLFLAGNFVLNLLASLVAFAIVRELGYSKLAATAAALLYLSRDMTYVENAWAAAISDPLAILLSGMAVLSALKAIKRSGALATLEHLFAYACFGAALLSKQSAFAIPGIVALLLLLRPGVSNPSPFKRRLSSASLALVLYGAFAGVVFLHARALLQQRTPYPMSLNLRSLLGSLCYICWFFADIDLLDKVKLSTVVPAGFGLAALIAFGLLLRHSPRLPGHKRKDVWFVLLAAVASLCVLLPLGERVVPYYGSMFAFWLSVAFGIALPRFTTGRRDHADTDRLLCLPSFADDRISGRAPQADRTDLTRWLYLGHLHYGSGTR